jgi:hypothetical protein
MNDTLIQQPVATSFVVTSGFGFEPTVHARGNGNKIYQNVAVFRSGTFRDSMGTQNTWEDLHLKQMMDNFSYLAGKKILPSVPVRNGHPGFLVSGIQGKGDVVGWHTDVKTQVLKSPIDGQQYDYLMVDYEIMAGYALANIESGLWRNRSAEIGRYTTNAEAELWPVYMGFAFVDIPAVEGLNFSSKQGQRCFVIFDGNGFKETHVSQPTGNAGGNGNNGPALPFPGVPSQQGTQAPFNFSINGQVVTDPTVVQAYVNRLEATFAEQRGAARTAFVKGLVSANKIPAPQEAEFAKFAEGLNDDQYTAWTAQWGQMGAMPLLQNHGGSVTNPGNTGQTTPQQQDITDAEEIVKNHERLGTPLEHLKLMNSYKTLVTAGRRPA